MVYLGTESGGIELTNLICREIGCWPWDVCAGIVIAQEAGCIITGSQQVFTATVDTPDFGEVTEEVLAGRKHVVVRAIADIEVSSLIPFII